MALPLEIAVRNSGVALWFSAETPLKWSPEIEIEGASETLADGAERYGVIAELAAKGGPIRVEQAVLSNVRVVRNYEDNGELPAEESARHPIRRRQPTPACCVS